MPRGRPLRNVNGYGSVVKLSGRRNKPYEVRVNTRMDERYYPVYDVLERFGSREDALLALAEYNRDPYSIADRNLDFAGVYEAFYRDKYEYSGKAYSASTVNCTKAAYGYCAALYGRVYRSIRAADFRAVLGQAGPQGKPLSHALQEHIKNLFSQMDKFALQNDIINKGYSAFVAITAPEDDQPGVPFTREDLATLWDSRDKPWVDSILIFIYSGWRVSELTTMPAGDIDLAARTFKGGIKTSAGKNRVVPIHSKIYGLVKARLADQGGTLFTMDGRAVSSNRYNKLFKATLAGIGITGYHTPHDCRHTFTSLLDSAGANPICIDRLIGHSSGSLTAKVYTHKDIEELRQAVELI